MLRSLKLTLYESINISCVFPQIIGDDQSEEDFSQFCNADSATLEILLFFLLEFMLNLVIEVLRKFPIKVG